MNEDRTPLNLLRALEDLYLWEQLNLPLAKTNAGHALFFYISIAALQHEEIRLKNIYYSLPFSEKTLRLLLRELENDAWILVSSKKKDMRYREIILTPKFHCVLDLWIKKIRQSYSKTTDF